MHVYIYDDFLTKGKYTKTVNRIETRLTDLGLSGKIVRLSNIKNFKGVIHGEVKRGAKTIVAVGNDATFNKLLNVLLCDEISFFFKNLLLAFIPVEPSLIGKSLGINNYQEACNILLARRNEKINVAQANKHFFISQAYINNANTEIKIGEDFTVKPLEKGGSYIINMPSVELATQMPSVNPKNSNLHVYIQDRNSSSFFTANTVAVSNKSGGYLNLDNTINLPLPAKLSVSDKQINLIVGKNRVFI